MFASSVAAGANARGVQLCGRQLRLDDERDIGHAAAEALRDFGDGACDQVIEVLGGQPECPEMGMGLFCKICFLRLNGLVTLRCMAPLIGIALGC